jgi:hypothetical protein
MLEMDSNNVFERAVNAAFMEPKKGGETGLVFENGSIEIVLRDGSREERVTLLSGDRIHFFREDSSITTRVHNANPGDRLRNHYIINFGNHGCLSVDGRDVRNKQVTLIHENDHVASSVAYARINPLT